MGMLGDLWRFATGASPASGRQRRASADALTSEVMASYRPGARVGMAGMGLSNDTPPLMQVLWDAEAMLSHPRVEAALSFYKGGIAGAKFSVEDASSPAAADFALSELRRFWQRGMVPAQRSYEYGRGASEIVYEEEEGLLRLAHMRAFMPLDCRVLLKEGQYVGVRVRGSAGAGAGDLWGPGALPAKVFWLAHDKRYSRWYGRPRLYPAWRPWRRLAGLDNAEETIDYAVYKYGVGTPVGRYPADDMQPNPATWGQTGPSGFRKNQDLMREFLEAKTARSVIALSSRRDEHGEYVWGFDEQDRPLDVSGLLEYASSLEDAISLGIGVPPELLQAEETGSGYSGRQIPLEAFLAGQQRNAEELAEAWHRQIGAPLLKWNFGPDAWARVKVEDLLESRLRQQGGTPGQAPPGGEKPGGPPGGPPPRGPKPQNFGHDFGSKPEKKAEGWVTLKDGQHVYIQGGKVHPHGPHDREKWERSARESGVDAGHLHALAHETMSRHNDHAGEWNEVLQKTRSMLGGHAKLLHLDRYEDADSVPGLDEAADYWRERNPRFGDADELFAALKEGNKKEIEPDEAYRRALDELESQPRPKQGKKKKPKADDDFVPFGNRFSAEFEGKHPRDAIGEFSRALAAHAGRTKARDAKKADAAAKSGAAGRLAALPLPDAPDDSAQTLPAWEAHGAAVLALAREAGADERAAAGLARIVERGKDAAARAAARVARATLGVEAVESARAALGPRPEEPDHPGYADEATEEEGERIDAGHDAALAEWEEDAAKWDAADGKLDAQDEKAYEALEKAQAAAQEAFDDAAERLNAAAEGAGAELQDAHDTEWSRLDDEEGDDPEPEPPEDEEGKPDA